MSDSLDEVQENSCRLSVESNEFSDYNYRYAVRKEKYDALVLDARLRQSLMTVRSLGRRGLRVAALGTFAGAPTFSSRWCQQAFVCSADEGAHAYLTYLEQLLKCTDAHVLITSSDATIALIREHRKRLERLVRIALAKEPALGVAINKEQTLEVARRLRLAIPCSITVGSVSEVEVALREVGLPAVIKPVESWIRQRGIRVESQLVTTPPCEECYGQSSQLLRCVALNL